MVVAAPADVVVHGHLLAEDKLAVADQVLGHDGLREREKNVFTFLNSPDGSNRYDDFFKEK